MRWLIAVGWVLVVAGCAEEPLPSAAIELAPAPPPFITTTLAEQTRIEFRPLTNEELSTVSVSGAEARATALAIGPQPFGEGDDVVTWTKVGCQFLGWYVGPRMPNHGQPIEPDAYPAYVVQVLGDPVVGWPGINVELVIVNAITGGQVGTFSGGNPFLMRTTCGISP